ncbi:hypothetical protein KR018_010700, partial [Drosophila ironensis]
QLLPPNVQPAEDTSANVNVNDASLVMTNAPAMSPAGGADCQQAAGGAGGAGGANGSGAGDGSSGALSPNALSQNSQNAATVAPGGSVGPGGSSVAGADLATGGSLDGSGGGGVGTGTPSAGGGGGGSCCENGRPIMTDPVSGQTVCSCQYDSARLALSSYSRLPAASVGVYGTPYPSTDQNPYQSIGVDSSAFYSPLSNPYGLKDTGAGPEMGAWTSAGLQPTTGYYSYDPMSAYGYGASYDLAARRKNATRESTATLKAWLNEHKKNPYPTKGEKIMLAIITKMTLTQVSTWFANARRRLKKENKMTWEPKNRTDDDDDALVSDDEKDKEDLEPSKGSQSGISFQPDETKEEEDAIDEDQKANILRAGFGYPSAGSGGGYHGGGSAAGGGGYHPYHHQHPAYYQPGQQMPSPFHGGDNSKLQSEHGDPKNQLGRDCGVPIPATKPKIWSLADTVGCKTPPPAYMAHQGGHPGMPQQPQQQPPQLQQQYPPVQMQQEPPPQQQQQQQHHLFNGAGGHHPYLRPHTTAYGGFLGATTQQLHTTSNSSSSYTNSNNSSSTSNSNSSNSSSNNSSSNSMGRQQLGEQQVATGSVSGTHTPTIHTMGSSERYQHLQHLQQLQQLQQRQHPSQRAMGFPEAQPDTPPQTPPNMKVSSGALSLLPTTTTPIQGSQVPMTATCRSSNAFGYFSARLGEYSPRDDYSSGNSSSSSSSSPHSHQHPQSQSQPHPHQEAIFKPLFRKFAN